MREPIENARAQPMSVLRLGIAYQRPERPNRILNLRGQRFGRLVVVRLLGSHRKQTYWLCQCDCGSDCSVMMSNLTRGITQSCGCLHRDNHTKHGGAQRGAEHPLYKAWIAMWERCRNPRNVNYQRYGGRGIRVCDRWRDFALFLSDMGEKPSPKHSLDRIDNDGNYEKGNCRWATRSEQATNSRFTSRRLAACRANVAKTPSHRRSAQRAALSGDAR